MKEYSLYEMSTLEEVYSIYMESFGRFSLPTPAYVKALDVCAEKKIPIEAVDLNDVDFTEAYCQHIGATEMVREAFFHTKHRPEEVRHLVPGGVRARLGPPFEQGQRFQAARDGARGAHGAEACRPLREILDRPSP